MVSERIEKRFPKEDVDKLNKMLRIIADELMPEIDGFHHVESRLDGKPVAARAGDQLMAEEAAAGEADNPKPDLPSAAENAAAEDSEFPETENTAE